MPGKVNPVILEAVISAGLKVKANNGLLAEAVQMGTLQINEYLPLIAETILSSLSLLADAGEMLAKHIELIEAGVEACQYQEENNEMLITAFLPHIGYEKGEALLHKYRTEKRGIKFRDFLQQELGETLVEDTLKPARLTALGYRLK